MNFGAQIKNLRTTENLTQGEMAAKLGISRQAVSNWENDRNLPDIEMLIVISQTFKISLDELILGGKNMNNMTQKLINDTNENRRASTNFKSALIGLILFALGTVCILLKAQSGSTVNGNGILQESFFLLPIAFLFFFAGFVTFLLIGIKNIVCFIKTKEIKNKIYMLISAGVIVLCMGLFLCLYASNANANTGVSGMVLTIIGMAAILLGIAKSVR